MNENKACPNCKTELKSGLISSVTLLSANKVAIINECHDKKADGYCNKCGKELHSSYKSQLSTEKNKLSSQIQSLISNIPVVSTHSPLNWDYEILEMVTGQSTTGTGVLTEFTSSFTDLFGTQSGRHNQKLKAGENMCFAQLRKQALDLGGNAVIATDIDYSEIGAAKGMLMVCMAGTAIKFKNIEILGNEKSVKIEKLISLNTRFCHLEKYDLIEY